MDQSMLLLFKYLLSFCFHYVLVEEHMKYVIKLSGNYWDPLLLGYGQCR